MTTIDITLASPAVAELVERALRAADYGIYEGEFETLEAVADAIKAARLRVEFAQAGQRFFAGQGK